jgi:hypothetical protein
MRLLAGLSVLLLASSCATTPPASPAESTRPTSGDPRAAVKVTYRQEVPAGCRGLGHVSDTLVATWGFKSAPEHLEWRLQKKAYKLGGDLVIVVSQSGGRSPSMTGEVYKCGPPPAS